MIDAAKQAAADGVTAAKQAAADAVAEAKSEAAAAVKEASSTAAVAVANTADELGQLIYEAANKAAKDNADLKTELDDKITDVKLTSEAQISMSAETVTVLVNKNKDTCDAGVAAAKTEVSTASSILNSKIDTKVIDLSSEIAAARQAATDENTALETSLSGKIDAATTDLAGKITASSDAAATARAGLNSKIAANAKSWIELKDCRQRQ